MSKPKIIIVGERPKSEVKKKPIKFAQGLLNDGTFTKGHVDDPTDFNYVELISRNYGDFEGQSFDLIFCYDDPDRRGDGVLYLGYWNDGVAE